MLLENKKALITGGTGAVGEKLCEIFSQEGADVAFNFAKSTDKASRVCRLIE